MRKKRFNGGSKLQRSVHTAHMQNTSKIPKQTQAIQNLLFAVRLAVSKNIRSDHLSGRHGEVPPAPPISNSTGEADIDAGEAADMEEGIRRRPSAPASKTRCRSREDQGRVAGTVLNKCKKNVNNIKITLK